MQSTPAIRDLLNIQRRFLRSTQIERDFNDPACLNGYVITPHVRDSIIRINTGLAPRSGLRSWRVTGDYGCGKSSFALLLAQLYARREAELRPQLRKALTDPIDAVRRSGIRFHPILVCGAREPIAVALLRALGRALKRDSFTGRQQRSATAQRIDELLARPQKINDRQALDLLEAAQREIASRGTKAGILIILDELGKFLEFAALHPERQDIFVLQQVAELAARSPDDAPLFVVGLLHQGFSAYAELLSQSAQREWEKVAGRFEELLFDQPLEQISLIIAEALSIKTDRLPRESDLLAHSGMREALRLRWYGASAPSATLQSLAPKLYPLHPSVMPAIVRFFRRWGQNERSLFSFLLSSERGGLQDFCRETTSAKSFYRISHLYDYAAANFGHLLAAQSYRSHWNHIDSLVRSFPTSSDEELAVLKTVAFLNLIEAPELVPTDEAVTLAVADDPQRAGGRIRALLERLHRDRHVLYSHGKEGGYRLWSHTSVNLDAAYEDAGRAVGTGKRIVQWIKDNIESRPLVARRHYIQTGTLRTFDIKYCDLKTLGDEVKAPLIDSDGRIILPLCETQDDVRAGETVARTLHGQRATLIGIPEPLASMEGLVQEVEKWKWVERNTPSLKDDKYAAEEVARQLSLSIRTLQSRIDHYVGMRFTTRRGELTIRWFHEGKKQDIRTGKGLMELVSGLCDDLYQKCPHVHNELINRKSISSAAALARTRLIERICASAGEALLGLDPSKKPPEIAMYLSVLRAGNIHTLKKSRWQMELPHPKRDICNLRPTLEEIGKILERSGDARLPVPELFSILRKPPYGVRDGLLPLLLAIYLQINWHRTALYEEGTYLHNVNSLEFVRLTKEPEHFEIQHCAIEGVRAEVFGRLLESLDIAGRKQHDLLDVVRPLAVFAAGLPDYSRRTKELSATALAIRTALLEAREPATLIFDALPKACGFAPFGPRWTGTKEARTNAVHAFADGLKKGIAELRGAYDRLLDRLELAVIETFGADRTLTATRSDLQARLQKTAQLVTDAMLKPFLFRLADDGLARRQWLESLASQVTRKPPERWTDQDEIEFRHQLVIQADRFSRVEAISFRSGMSIGHAFHLVLTRPDGSEVQEVVHLDDAEGPASNIEEEVSDIIARHGKRGLAAIAKAVWGALQDEHRKESSHERD